MPVLKTNLAVNLHAFSYDGAEPMIIQRTTNETARLVEYVNAPFFAKQ